MKQADCGMRISDCRLENSWLFLNPQSEIRIPQSFSLASLVRFHYDVRALTTNCLLFTEVSHAPSLAFVR
jgi:hypothetical protein